MWMVAAAVEDVDLQLTSVADHHILNFLPPAAAARRVEAGETARRWATSATCTLVLITEQDLPTYSAPALRSCHSQLPHL